MPHVTDTTRAAIAADARRTAAAVRESQRLARRGVRITVAELATMACGAAALAAHLLTVGGL